MYSSESMIGLTSCYSQTMNQSLIPRGIILNEYRRHIQLKVLHKASLLDVHVGYFIT